MEAGDEQAVVRLAVRRVGVRLAVTVGVLAFLWWFAGFQPFYAAVVAGASIPIAAALLWWTWRAVRRGRSDRREDERRRRARRSDEEQDSTP